MTEQKPNKTLALLLMAKEHSDAGRYKHKTIILRQLMRSRPDDWEIDSEDENGIVGLTHSPTRFRLHLPKNAIPRGVSVRSMLTQEKTATTAELRRARKETDTTPTPAQAEAGNYAKGIFRLCGVPIKLENPKGTIRKGYNADGSVAWECLMKADYGYFAGTDAADGDAVDCFIGPNLESELVVAIDQYRGKEFDETKFVLGVDSREEGEKLYLAHYPKGWKLGPVSTTTVHQLKIWLKDGDTKSAFKGQMIKAAAVLPPKSNARDHHRYLADDDEHEKYTPVGMDGLLAATEKLLAVNRGLADPDDRDSLPNDRIYTVDRLMAERVKLDHGKALRGMMGRLSRARNLGPMGPNTFGSYTVGYITSNPLVPALEEINPMHILEQKRRLTKMGPGGIGDSNAITEDMNAVSATQFGFIDPIAGPESVDRDTLILSDLGWVTASKVTMKCRLACNIDGRLEFRRPYKVHCYPFTGEMIGVKTKFVDFLVTPTHRIWHRDTDNRNALGRAWQMKFAEDIFNRAVNFEMTHAPALFDGEDTFTGIAGIEFPMKPWCKFLAYWMADGSSFAKGHQTRITHSRIRPAYKGICETLDALGLDWKYTDTTYRARASDFPTGDFVISHPGVTAYLRQFGKAGAKYLPEYVIHQSVEVREAVWQALMETDRRINKSHTSFVSTSKRFARVVERLLVSLGHPVSFREEPDSREHVVSTNWVVSKLKQRTRQARMPYHNGWYKQAYDDLVYCVTVPGGMIFTRRGNGLGHWTGNSEKAGIDVRLAHGTRIGSDGRIYQLLLNRRTGKKQWVSPSDLQGKTLKLPD